MPIDVERVDFVSIPVRDLARARRFYGELLRLPRGGPAPDEFEAGNVTLALWAPRPQDPARAGPRRGRTKSAHFRAGLVTARW